MKNLYFVTVLIFTQLCWTQTEENRGYKVKVGEEAPQLSFSLMDGTPVTNESLKGKVVVLQFTASWCSVCRAEMPHLESEVWQRFKDDDFILIGIDLKETPEKVKLFIEEMGISYPIAIDSDGSLFESFTLPQAGVTRNIVLDKKGKIIFLTRLYEREEFEQMIEVIEKKLNK
jgi:peroxiredoxin